MITSVLLVLSFAWVGWVAGQIHAERRLRRLNAQDMNQRDAWAARYQARHKGVQ